MAKKPLPIVWYLDESSLPDEPDRANKIERIVNAIAAWEATGTQSLIDLQEAIDNIVKSK
jgi:hypothetical protein